MTDEKDLAKLSGEDNIMGAPRWELPIVRLQGKDGVFQKIAKDKEPEDLAETIKGVSLNFRRTLTRFVSDKGKLKESYFTSEHSSSNDEITVFVRNKDGEVSVVDNGNASKMKEKHSLKMVQIIYFFMGDEIVKLNVKGSSLSALYEFRPEVRKLEKHFHELLLEVGMIKQKSELGDYFTMEFTIGKDLTDKEKKQVAGKITEVSDKIEEIDSYYRNSKEPGEEIEEAIKKEGAGLEEEEEIDPAKIPF